MAWMVQVLEITDEHGHGTDKYRKVANSDGEGGMHPLCEHQHDSIDEADKCPEALAKTEEITGIPDGGNADRAAQLEAEAERMLAEAAQLKAQDEASET
ncbi:hypothetical protein H6F76_17670 [Leptolyngbya sp. FACHB-321]|uniref:hypothetical protein n=1 Tax=Leptolyngbya sp. FACHB-321 TaxID=2692807 RepID=UPI001683256D|nr:hypothetical protein [Leptolyngbya sp. FACHB-321]MBD2036840.1 hypothetical protein [Leptolyngbya sp. FACHB-321]